jgi:hypothetical protein
MDSTMMIVVGVVMVVIFVLHKIAVWYAPTERISPQRRHTCENKKSDDTIEDEKKTQTEDDDDQLPSYSEMCHGYQA